MITLTAGEIALLVGGKLHCDADLLISKAPVFDSRLATPGSFFLALKGENRDGHEFVAEAYRLQGEKIAYQEDALALREEPPKYGD